MEKGKHGYIAYRKKKQIGLTVLIAVIAIAVFIAGYLLNDNSRNNIFTVIAVLFTLPGAKMLIGYIVVAPFHDLSTERYNKICGVVDENSFACFDLVITSTEKVMNLDAVIIDEKHVFALLGKEKQDASYIQTYLARTIKNQGYAMEVKLFTDIDKFVLRLKALQNEKKEMKKVEGISDGTTGDEENGVPSTASEVKKLILTWNV